MKPVVWKSEEQTRRDWAKDGKLSLEFKVAKEKRRLRTGNATKIPVRSHLKKDVFISYGSEDSELASQICDYLESQGIGCWIAPRDIKAGASYAEEIVNGIENAQILTVVISKNSISSVHVKRELELATSGEKTIIPIRIEDVVVGKDIQYFLVLSQWIDAWGKKRERALLKLTAAIRIILSKNQ